MLLSEKHPYGRQVSHTVGANPYDFLNSTARPVSILHGGVSADAANWITREGSEPMNDLDESSTGHGKAVQGR